MNRTSFPDLPSSSFPRRPGFTLVELMVVIGIIGLLISIAVPALSHVIKSSKISATQSTIGTLGTALETFRADTQLGGAYPPSMQAVAYNPHRPARTTFNTQGAYLLVWAVAGADLMGTPGFRNADGISTDGNNNPVPWASDTHRQCGGTMGLYAIYGAPDCTAPIPSGQAGKPVHARSGPFVDMSKMKLPTPDPASGKFILDKIDGKPPTNSVCFLDSFNQPILYYRANIGARYMTSWGDGTGLVQFPPNGVYDMTDNEFITGSPVGGGTDLGAGPVLPNGAMHNLAELGDPTAPDDVQKSPRGSFTHVLRNRSVIAAPRPHRDDSYLLLSAGPDGIFGTPDDIANAELWKDK